MEIGEAVEVPKYGMGDLGTHDYKDKNVSGLPESYAVLIEDVVSSEIGKTGGIFLDVGGGTGELAKRIEENNGLKTLSMDLSILGVIENNNKGLVADARRIPLVDNVAGIVHAKDVVEHFDDQDLATFTSEVKRVLVAGGKLIITEKNYYTNFPFFQKPEIYLSINSVKKIEKILEGENYSQTVKRLKEKYDSSQLIGIPYIPRSKDQIIQRMNELGFKCDNSFEWKPQKNEPDWFSSRLSRNVMTFSLNKSNEK